MYKLVDTHTKSINSLVLIWHMLGLVSINPIVRCYICYYVWLNVVINKISLLLSKIMVHEYSDIII